MQAEGKLPHSILYHTIFIILCFKSLHYKPKKALFIAGSAEHIPSNQYFLNTYCLNLQISSVSLTNFAFVAGYDPHKLIQIYPLKVQRIRKPMNQWP
jgi:hypothetical protein